MSLIGPDVVIVVPERELEEMGDGMVPNAAKRRRRKERWVVPPEEMYGGFTRLLVKTALVRSPDYEKGPPLMVRGLDDVVAVVKHLIHYDQEHIVTLAISSTAECIAIHEVAIGPTGYAATTGKHVLKVSFMTAASAVVIVHNHPSGSPEPSREDTSMTSSLKELCDLVGITLLDHVIVARDGYSSFAAGETWNWQNRIVDRFRAIPLG